MTFSRAISHARKAIEAGSDTKKLDEIAEAIKQLADGLDDLERTINRLK